MSGSRAASSATRSREWCRAAPGRVAETGRPPANFPPVYPVVRFNDIVGNAQAGLRIGPNENAAIDATCNWWGSDSGPSGIGTGTGDAVVVEPGAVVPIIVPFAHAPIARTTRSSC